MARPVTLPAASPLPLAAGKRALPWEVNPLRRRKKETRRRDPAPTNARAHLFAAANEYCSERRKGVRTEDWEAVKGNLCHHAPAHWLGASCSDGSVYIVLSGQFVCWDVGDGIEGYVVVESSKTVVFMSVCMLNNLCEHSGKLLCRIERIVYITRVALA